MKKPSVTELCDLLNKPQLIKWANKIGLQGTEINSYQKSVFKDGNKKHLEIENFLLNGELMQDEELQNKISQIFCNAENIIIEQSFENELYKGRVDVMFNIDGIKYIGDFKRKFKRPYLEHYIQLVAYKMHFMSDKICIIDLEKGIMHDLSKEDYTLYENLIHNLINIYNIKQKL